MSNPMLIAHETSARTISQAMRLYVGRGKPHSAVAIGDAAGISKRTIDSYVAGDATPGLAALLSLFSVLPPAFATAVLRPACLEARRCDPDQIAPQSLLADLTASAAELAAHLEDGRLDHRERARFAKTAMALTDALRPFTDISA